MIWISIVVMALITFFNRYVFFTRHISYQPSNYVKKFLSYSTSAVLTAIWVPIVFSIERSGVVSYAGLDYLLGAGLATILSMARVSMLITVLVSSSVFFGLRFLLFTN